MSALNFGEEVSTVPYDYSLLGWQLNLLSKSA
jgi:hypothetical protein